MTDAAQKPVPAYHKVLFLLMRLLFAVFLVTTSSYCLLAYIPFTFHWVINGTLIKWLSVFVRLHTILYWVVLGLVTLTLVPDVRRPRTRRLTVSFVVVHAAAGVILVFYPLLSSLANDDRSFYWSLISLVPLLWIAIIDYVGSAPERKWSRSGGEQVTIQTVVLAAVYVSLLYVGSFYLRFDRTGAAPLRPSELLVALSWSLATHLLIFIAAFVLLRLIRGLAEKFAGVSKVEFLLCNVVVVSLAALLVRTMILPALTFHNRTGDIFSVAIALAVVGFFSGLSLRLQPAGEEIISGFRLSLAPLLAISPGSESRWLVRAGYIVLLSIVAYGIPAAVAMRDWDFLIQKLGVVAIWAMTLVFFYGIQVRMVRKQYTTAGILLIVILPGGWYTILASTQPLWPSMMRDERLDVGATLERYSNYDLSFKLARNILSPKFGSLSGNGASTAGDGLAATQDPSFYGFLEQNTNLLPSVKVSPVDIELAGKLERTEGNKPNIFIFVIDSLRPDYLSPYNRKVSFTPNIDAFARESAVMRNAFTRYGGTVLAEPSIWTGTLQLHKQYIEPFYPMNSLQKLIETEGYESFITIDPVVRIMTKPSADVNELDKDNLWFEYDFCRSLHELQTRIGERQADARPMFVYTQPQNVHRVVLKDKGEPVPPGEHYPGFYAPYASQVKYMDRCFGEFIAFLKLSNLYDNSIVILTSDHGDSLGEEGRWGHSYWMFPEILKVPLMIHLPAAMQKGFQSDPKAVSFTTDITPTLFYLLGHRPIAHNPIFGRPLITATAKEQSDYMQESYLVVSSYGPVYGILSEHGRSLFIADAVNKKSYFFNLAEDPEATHNRLTAPIQAASEKLIREFVESINQFYGLNESP